MAVYTVHEPPLRATEAAPDPERFVFVRDGFSIWAFLVAALWMLWHRMWLILVVYVVVAAGLETVLRYAGVGSPVLSIVALLISLLVGIEAGTLRRFMLARRGWKYVGIVSAYDVEDAERRFFDSWVGAVPTKGIVPSTAPRNSPPPTLLPRMPPPDVIGLFPEPGASR
jgi:hypothetical protein